MRRRSLLALCGSLAAGTAGCLGGPDASAPGTVTSTPPTADGTPTDAVGEVRSVAVLPGVVAPTTPDSIGVLDRAGQYLAVEFAGDGVPRSSFSFHFGGGSIGPIERSNGFYRDGEWGVGYEDGSGLLVFALPEQIEADEAELTWAGGAWQPPATVRERLAGPLPSFDVALEGPRQVGPEVDPEISVTVTNTGSVAGRYALALNRTGPMVAYAPVRRIAGDLAAGESTVHTDDATSPYETDGEPREVTYRLDVPDGERLSHVVRPGPTEPVGTAVGTATDG